MLISKENEKTESSKNAFILMKEGRAWNNEQVLKAIFKLWKPLAKYLGFDREHEREHKQVRNYKKTGIHRMGII